MSPQPIRDKIAAFQAPTHFSDRSSSCLGNTGEGGYNTRKVVTYNTLDSAKKIAYNTLGSIFARTIFDFFLNSAKGQFAEVVVYNTLGSKI